MDRSGVRHSPSHPRPGDPLAALNRVSLRNDPPTYFYFFASEFLKRHEKELIGLRNEERRRADAEAKILARKAAEKAAAAAAAGELVDGQTVAADLKKQQSLQPDALDVERSKIEGMKLGGQGGKGLEGKLDSLDDELRAELGLDEGSQNAAEKEKTSEKTSFSVHMIPRERLKKRLVYGARMSGSKAEVDDADKKRKKKKKRSEGEDGPSENSTSHEDSNETENSSSVDADGAGGDSKEAKAKAKAAKKLAAAAEGEDYESDDEGVVKKWGNRHDVKVLIKSSSELALARARDRSPSPENRVTVESVLLKKSRTFSQEFLERAPDPTALAAGLIGVTAGEMVTTGESSAPVAAAVISVTGATDGAAAEVDGGQQPDAGATTADAQTGSRSLSTRSHGATQQLPTYNFSEQEKNQALVEELDSPRGPGRQRFTKNLHRPFVVECETAVSAFPASLEDSLGRGTSREGGLGGGAKAGGDAVAVAGGGDAVVGGPGAGATAAQQLQLQFPQSPLSPNRMALDLHLPYGVLDSFEKSAVPLGGLSGIEHSRSGSINTRTMGGSGITDFRSVGGFEASRVSSRAGGVGVTSSKEVPGGGGSGTASATE